MRSSVICTADRMLLGWGDQMEEHEMGETGGTWVEKRMTQSVLVWKPVRKWPLESTGNRWEGMDRIDLVQDKNKWWAVVNSVEPVGSLTS